MNPALPSDIHSILLNSLKDAFVFVDTEHVIQYMNKAAVLRYKDGDSLMGQSIFSCHNISSRDMMIEIFEKMYLIFTVRAYTKNLPRSISKPFKIYFLGRPYFILCGFI